MSLGIIERNRYEIIAVFREEFRRQTDIEISIFGTKITTKIININAGSFSIKMNVRMVEEEHYTFVLHSASGKIEFSSTLHANLDRADDGNYSFHLPDEIKILQRRIDKRLPLHRHINCSCRGRYKNGKNYTFQIVDISSGGCALMSESQYIELQGKNVILKQALLKIDDYGEITVDLAVRNVSKINTIPDGNRLDTLYKVSCQFMFRTTTERLKVDKLVTELLMDHKRRKVI